MLCAVTNAVRLSCRQPGFGALGSSRTHFSPLPPHIRPTSHPLQQQRSISQLPDFTIGSGIAMILVSIEHQSPLFLVTGSWIITVGLICVRDRERAICADKLSDENKPSENNTNLKQNRE